MPAAGQSRQQFAGGPGLALHDLCNVGGNPLVNFARSLVRRRRRADRVRSSQHPGDQHLDRGCRDQSFEFFYPLRHENILTSSEIDREQIRICKSKRWPKCNKINSRAERKLRSLAPNAFAGWPVRFFWPLLWPRYLEG